MIDEPSYKTQYKTVPGIVLKFKQSMNRVKQKPKPTIPTLEIPIYLPITEPCLKTKRSNARTEAFEMNSDIRKNSRDFVLENQN